MKKTLSDLCSFADGRVAVDVLDLDTYISTENMLQNKEGITRSAGLPTVSQTQAYQPEDVLVSNIRPYCRNANQTAWRDIRRMISARAFRILTPPDVRRSVDKNNLALHICAQCDII